MGNVIQMTQNHTPLTPMQGVVPFAFQGTVSPSFAPTYQPRLTPNLYLVNYGSFAAGTWTSLFAGTAGARCYVLYLALTTNTATQIALATSSNNTLQYCNCYLGIGQVFYISFGDAGWNTGARGDGIQMYTLNAAAIGYSILICQMATTS